MTIGIDARSITGKTCGVSRVVTCLLNALSEKNDGNSYIVYTNDFDKIPLGPNFKIKKTGLSRMNFLKDYSFSRIVNQDGVDVFFSGHSWLPIFLSNKIRKIVTIHDIFSITDRNFFKKRGLLAPLYRLYFYLITLYTVLVADVILTVSNYCVKEIRRIYPFVNDVRVMYPSPGITKDTSKVKMKKQIESKYILYVGNFRSYKNVDTLIEAYAQYSSLGGSYDLVLAGNDEYTEISKRCSQLKIIDRVHSFYRPSDEVLYTLYCNAEMLVQPSNYEGFGIPPLEAMSFSVPVIISDADALVEIADGAALIFQKNNPDELASKLKQLEENDELKKTLILKGEANFVRFSWLNSIEMLRSTFVS